MIRLYHLIPGLLLSIAIAVVAFALDEAEHHFTGNNWIEALVLAIVLGMAVRTLFTPGRRFNAGIDFSAKLVLEIAVVLLGASISARDVMAAGPLILGIFGVVAVAIAASYGIGRLLRLPHRMALLVACGNAICGNSAIAATAPIIGANGEEIASSIAFTALLGVVVVLCLPFLVPLLELSDIQYGILAGLTVYAVPQVIAATAPVSAVSVQLGTLVKLVRVLMLGPVVLGLSLVAGRGAGAGRLRFTQMVPWFILGFLAMMALRSASLIPEDLLPHIRHISTWLAIISMAALGLGVDVRAVAKSGGRIILTAILSLGVLIGISLVLIRLMAVQ